MGVNDNYLFNGVANIILFQRVVGPRLMGITPDEALIAEAMPKAETVFSELERLLAGKPYFTGADVSLARHPAGLPHRLLPRHAPSGTT